MVEFDKLYINSLIERIREGDINALSEIYKQASSRMLSIAMGIVKNRQLAEEIVQDAFLIIAKKAGQFKFKNNGYGWICTIVRNTALNTLKSEKRRMGVNIDSFYNLSDNYNLLCEAEITDEIERALMNLDENEKQLIHLKYYGEMTVREIAKATNISKSSVDRILKRAEEKILKNIDKREDF